MVRNALSCFLLIGLFILGGSSRAVAGSIKPVCDTLPGNNKNPDQTSTKKNEEPIKEVPKSRKQDKPLAITPVVVKPVIVKPKIIVRPVIKLH